MRIGLDPKSWCCDCGYLYGLGHLNNQVSCVSSHLPVMLLVHGYYAKTLTLWSHFMALFMYIITQVIFQKSESQKQNNLETNFKPFQSIPCHFKPLHLILHKKIQIWHFWPIVDFGQQLTFWSTLTKVNPCPNTLHSIWFDQDIVASLAWVVCGCL
jgi:hypothetical protein